MYNPTIDMNMLPVVEQVYMTFILYNVHNSYETHH